jgi:transposase
MAKRAAELRELARTSAGVRMLTQQHWEAGLDYQAARRVGRGASRLVDQVQQVCVAHPYTPIIESLPVKSPSWTATLIAVIGDVGRFRNYAEFRAYLGWSPQVERSGSSLNSSKLANSGVRSSRRVLGQMVLILLTPVIRDTPFRAFYNALIARGMRPAKAMGTLPASFAPCCTACLRR